MLVTVRQLRELVARLLWCLKLPGGLEYTASRLVLEAELQRGDGLQTLWESVNRNMQIQPDRVRIKFRDNGVVLVDGGGETAVYVASLLSDLACEQAFHNGSGVVVAHHVRYPGFGLGLPKLVTAKCGAKASCTISTGTQIQGCVIDEDVFRVEAATTRIRAETGTIIVVVADGAARKPRAVVDRTVLRKGIEIDQALWDAAFARSLSVLLPRKRRLVDYIGST